MLVSPAVRPRPGLHAIRLLSALSLSCLIMPSPATGRRSCSNDLPTCMRGAGPTPGAHLCAAADERVTRSRLADHLTLLAVALFAVGAGVGQGSLRAEAQLGAALAAHELAVPVDAQACTTSAHVLVYPAGIPYRGRLRLRVRAADEHQEDDDDLSHSTMTTIVGTRFRFPYSLRSAPYTPGQCISKPLPQLIYVS